MNKEERAEYQKQWYKEHGKQYYKEHRNEMLASVKQYYDKHRDEILAYKRLYSKQYREQNKDKRKQSEKAWIENHRERHLEIKRKVNSKRRRGLGFIPLNEWFEGSEAHHICPTFVIYIPKELHQSIGHSVFKWKNMEQINKLAWDFKRIQQ